MSAGNRFITPPISNSFVATNTANADLQQHLYKQSDDWDGDRDEILVIDDDSRLLNLLKQVLETNGYVVMTAIDGLEGLKIFTDRHPKLVITDIIMPEVDGIDVIRICKEAHHNQKIIAMSGGSHHLSANFNLKIANCFGIHTTLAKPFSNQDFLVAVKSAFEESDETVESIETTS
jgi:DNA-binding NtrC family response regulator